jgi:hypothetical protein
MMTGSDTRLQRSGRDKCRAFAQLGSALPQSRANFIFVSEIHFLFLARIVESYIFETGGLDGSLYEFYRKQIYKTRSVCTKNYVE